MFVLDKILRTMLLLVSAAASITALAAPSSQVQIDSAIANGATLVINGQNFGGTVPTVQLGQTPLAMAQPATASRLVVALPADVVPGSYELLVSFGNSSNQQATLGVTIGAAGPQGATGAHRARRTGGATGAAGLPAPRVQPVQSVLPAGRATGAAGPSAQLGQSVPRDLPARVGQLAQPVHLAPRGRPGPRASGASLSCRRSTAPWSECGPPEPNYDVSSAWATVAANGTAIRIPLSNWADSGPVGTPDTPELLGLTRASLESAYLSSDCSGKPISGLLTWDGIGRRLPGIRTLLLAPVAGTRTVRYYDAAFAAYGENPTANSRAFYDSATGKFVCEPGFANFRSNGSA